MNFIAAVIICTSIHYGVKDDYLSDNSESMNLEVLEEKAFSMFCFAMEKTGFRKIMLIERGYIA